MFAQNTSEIIYKTCKSIQLQSICVENLYYCNLIYKEAKKDIGLDLY